MNWFPHLLSPLAAGIAAAVAVPSLLVLYFLKLRRREMPVSSTFLWRKAVQDMQVNAPFQRLRRNLLLFLQLLALLALIAALARPVTNYTPGAGKLSVILIDRSASMAAADGLNGRTRLDEAKRLATDLVDGMDKGGQATVIAFDDSAEVVQTFTADASVLRSAISGIEQTDRPTKLKQAYQLAGAQAVFIPEQNRANVKPTVYLYSDGRVSDANDLALDGDLKYTPIGTETAGNLAVVELDAKRSYDNPVQVQVFARLANFGPEPKAATVRLTVNGQPTKVTDVALKPERWNDPDWRAAHPGQAKDFPERNSAQFTFDMPEAGVVRVEQMNKGRRPAVGRRRRGRGRAAAQGAVGGAGDGVAGQPVPGAGVREPGAAGRGRDVGRGVRGQAAEAVRRDPVRPVRAPVDAAVGQLHLVRVRAARRQGSRRAEDGRAVRDRPTDVSVLDWQRDHPILPLHCQVGDLLRRVNMLKLAVPPEAHGAGRREPRADGRARPRADKADELGRRLRPAGQ